MQEKCNCGRGYMSAWDGKCGHCRTKSDKKVLHNMQKNAVTAPGPVMIKNKHRDQPTPHDVYIGRGSPLGNPYPIEPKPGKSRKEVIAAYETWLDAQLKNGNQKVIAALNSIANDSLDGKPVNLVCFCAPCDCHGRIIKNLVDAAVRTELATKDQHK